MASAIDDEDLAISINTNSSRRNSGHPADPPGYGHSHDHHDQQQQQPHHGRQSATMQRANQRLGQYHIKSTLGEGSFGKVKLAVHQVTGQQVALKIISRRKLVARDMAGRVEREIQYLQLLRHPHIIKLYTVITTATEIIMVLEYAGSELFNYIVDHGKMMEGKARQFFQQIVCAVEYCHRHKIVHRDLKPENLLLDENLHVKIADFGLSNIMTDGNFLKTSCGSPNYAAPEVISGKLYAGPEVDVWSCGVILYVLLVGKLPFDDDYIPALFKKIAQGQYSIPSYLSQGPVRLIRKMLQISPVHRITVQEIRQDPWFVVDLPEYLQPPVEEFLDTGVDPNRAIDPRQLAPNKPPEVQDRIHDSVVGKLGKTMGYGKEDVQQALAIDEPNAIKDAYLIVRENQIMKETPSLAQNPALQPYLAQSPPINNVPSPIASITEAKEHGPPQSHQASRRKPESPQHTQSHPSDMRPRQPSTSGAAAATPDQHSRSPVNTIGVLPSSLPDYHASLMKVGKQATSPTPTEQSDAARLFKPHSKSQVNLERMNKPDAFTPIDKEKVERSKKPKPTKWQFGIRSRNAPAEAMLAIYKALQSMGAEWEVPKNRRPDPRNRRNEEEFGSSSDEYDDYSDSSENEGDGGSAGDHDESQLPDFEVHSPTGPKHSHNNSSNTNSTNSSTRYRRHRRKDEPRRQRSLYSASNDWGYSVPQDPWIISARFRKAGMHLPGILHPNSAHSSMADLLSGMSSSGGSTSALHAEPGESPDNITRRGSALSSSGSAHSNELTRSTTNEHSNSPSATGSRQNSLNPLSRPESGQNLHPSSAAATGRDGDKDANDDEDDTAYVYLTIQLYSIEKEFYLVDFKCAGYERLVRHVARELKESMRELQDVANGEHELSRLKANVEGQDMHHDFNDEDFEEREEFVGEGRAVEEKDVSSPFPFLDVASRLIIQLAEAD